MKKKLLLLLLLLPYVNANATTMSQYVTDLSKTDTVNMSTSDPDHNPRYIGLNPNNYVLFNNELWRIVGVFDGKIKLMRSQSLGTYSWDSSDSSINGGLGVNNWATSDLMHELNGDYLNYNLTSNTKWYNGANNLKTSDFDYKNVIKKDAQELIVDTIWHTKSANVYQGNYISTSEQLTADSLYYYERNGINATLNPGTPESNDNQNREATWIGKVGLPYISDYMYATAGSDNIPRNECLGSGQWRHELNLCKATDWVVKNKSNGIGWAISTFTVDSDNRTVFRWLNSAEGNQAAWTSNVYPVVYLNPQVYITKGTGTESDPYQLSLYHEVELIDGDENEIIRVEHDTKVSYKELTKEGFTFLGWYEDLEFNNKYDFNNLVSSPKKLYARWVSNEEVDNNQDTQEQVKGVEEVIINNPKTGDSLYIYIGLIIVALIGLFTLRFLYKIKDK